MNILAVGNADQMPTSWLVPLNLLCPSVAISVASNMCSVKDMIDTGLKVDILLFVVPNSVEKLKSDIEHYHRLVGPADKTLILIFQNGAGNVPPNALDVLRIKAIETVQEMIELAKYIRRRKKSATEKSASRYSLRSDSEFDATRSKDSPHLTPRQEEVLTLVNQGKSNKEIARELNLTEGTVKVHCKAIFRELGVANRTQAAVLFSKTNFDWADGIATN